MFSEANNIWEWFSGIWFAPATLLSFDYEFPILLYGIPAVPLLFFLRWLLFFRFRQKIEIAFFEGEVKRSWGSLLRFIPDIIQALSLMLILFALARPQRTNEQIEQYTEGIDIMLVLDLSESMRIEDFKPNRLEASKEVARKFIAGRFQDRIGIVVFAGDAFSLSPLTTDYKLLDTYLSEIDFGLISKPGTAIGSALGVATNRMRESKARSKVLILISDGENTAGNIDPITAAELAKAYGIKIYSIAVGKEGAVPVGTDAFGNTVYEENTLDETTLRKIASMGEGQFFRASNNKALDEIFTKINTYEKAEIKETRYKDTRDFYHIYLTWAIVFFLLWLATKNTFMSNALED